MDRPGSGSGRLIALLVLLNLGVLAAGLAGHYLRDGQKPLMGFNAGKIQLREDLVPEDSGPAGPDDPVQAVEAPPADAGPGVSACLAWPSLDDAGLSQVLAHMRAAGVEEDAYALQLDKRLGWWVFLPPMANAAALAEVMADARSKGVTDLAPVRGGKMVNALSLGIFPSLEAARQHADEMTRKGLRDVRFAPRPGVGRVRLVELKADRALTQALSGPWAPGIAPGPCVVPPATPGGVPP